MKVFKRICEVKEYLKEQQNQGKTVGLVPTMGYLHEGHMSLIHRASAENDVVVVSIFVNPIQFGAGEDFGRYPRDFERDRKLAETAGASVIFVPEATEMYPDGYSTYVEVENITGQMCGASRPGHFRGVATVVLKLFNIIRPERAYFGQKDAQQVVVIERMVRDLNHDLDIVVCPIVRESDGLAMSSRNVYLSEQERSQALVLSQALNMAAELIAGGERAAVKIRDRILKMIAEKNLAVIDYAEIVNGATLSRVETISGETLIALAVKFGSTRLIDNIVVEV